jgi:hypothetical protein
MSPNLEPLQHLIHQGHHSEAREWLLSNQRIFSTLPMGQALNAYYTALCSSGNELELWEKAIKILEGFDPSILLLRSYKEAHHWAQVGSDLQRQRDYLQKSVELSKRLANADEQLELRATYANRLLLDGLPERAQTELIQVVQDAILERHQLLIIAEGTILAALYMHQNRWRDTAALCIAIESAAKVRLNWLALASARMMRASAWMAEEKFHEAINLLFDTGDFCFDKGAVAALHLIRARLVELQTQLGDEQFQRYSGRQF